MQRRYRESRKGAERAQIECRVSRERAEGSREAAEVEQSRSRREQREIRDEQRRSREGAQK